MGNRSMMSRLVAVLAALSLVGGACGDDAETDIAITGEPEPVETEAPTDGGGSDDGGSDDGGSDDGGGEEADQAEAGIDVEAVTGEVTAAVESWREASGAPGVALSLRLPDTESIEVAVGTADLTTDEPVSTDDFFRIASITKPMTAAVVLDLVDEGLVELDETVSTYIPGWLGDHPSAEEITVRQLLDHTSGLIEYAFDPGFYVEAAARPSTPYEPEEILEYLSRQDPLFEPGTEYSYETGGFVAAGLLIEAVTGNDAVDEMHEHVFDPAGAEDIYLTPDEFPPEQVVHGYSRGELYDALVLLPAVDDDLGLTVDGEPVIDMLDGPQAVLQSAGWTGGGNEAQVDDVSAIFRAMFDGTILSDGAIEAMTEPVLDAGYGLGIDVGESNGVTVYQHGGGVPGFRSQAGYLPDHDVAYAFSANLIPLPEGADVGALQDDIVEIALDALS